jgi:hypothetical protein
MSLVYKAVATKATTNKNTFSGNVSSDNLSVSTGGSIYDNTFFFDASKDYYIKAGSAVFDEFTTFPITINEKIILSNLTSDYALFGMYSDNAGTQVLFFRVYNDKIRMYIADGANNSTVDSSAIFDTNDINVITTLSISLVYNTTVSYLKIYKNGITTPIYTVNFGSTTHVWSELSSERYIRIGIAAYDNSFYLKNILIDNTEIAIEDVSNYHTYDILTYNTPIIYTMENQDYISTVKNSGTLLTTGDATLIKSDGEFADFYHLDPLVPNTASYHKMFDNNIHNNILSTENISSNDVIPYTIPSCEYLAERQAIMKDKAREKAAEKTNYTFCYDINDDYYTNYMSVGTRTYVPWFFLYDSRGMVDSTTGYCSAIDLLDNNTVNSTVYAEYGNSGTRNWMVDFKRKLFGTHKISPLTIYNDTAFRVQLHRTEKWKPSFAWLQTYGSATNYDSVYNICSDDWGVPGAFHFIDTIDVDYDGHRYFDLRISNNYNFEFTQIGSNTYTYDYVNWNYKTAPLRFNKTSLDYYKKINPSAMRIIPGTYQVFFDYEHSLLRNYDYDWNLIPYKKVVTLGYFIFIVDTSTNKFSIFDTYIDYNNEEIDMTANPADDTYFKYGQNSSYGYFTLPNDLTETQFYVVSPIYSNIILAGQTNVFPTYKRVGGALDRMEFNSKVPTKANATKLIPKTKAKIHFKKIV